MRGRVDRCAISDRARNWLDLGALLDDWLAEAVARGEDRVTRDAVAAVLGTAAPAPSIRERWALPNDDAVGEFLRERAA